MITYWLVALAVALLIVDFNSYLKSGRFTPYRQQWTIPDSLIALSTITAIFCVGMAWRYYVGSLDRGSDVLGSWLPIVLILLALGIITGIVESWRGPTQSSEPIKDPYHLLETSAPLAEAPLFQSKRTKKLALRGGTLALSILIGFSGAALLLNWGAGDVESSFFANERVRPTAQPTQTSSILETLDEVTENMVAAEATTEGTTTEGAITEDAIAEAANIDGVAGEGTVDENNLSILEGGDSSTPAIGGPVEETALEEFTRAAPATTNPYEIAINPSSNYTIVIQALLGVKARNQPSTEGEVIEVLTYGNQYQAVGRTSDGGWIQVRFEDGRVAWIITKAIDGLLFNEQQQIVALDELDSLSYNQQK